MRVYPYATVAASAATYSLNFRAVTQGAPLPELRTRIKAISGAHSVATTLVAIWLLQYGKWPIDSSVNGDVPASKVQRNDDRLDDSRNPIIAGHNTIANVLTAWEAGYLLYDTGALLAEVRLKYKTGTARATIVTLGKTSPVFLAHHAALIVALTYLQHYIATGREKGLWVIVAMLAMNASNPLLHLRWYLKKQTGKSNVQVDAALAIVFAVSRFGNMFWILKQYGQHHSLGAVEALSRQRIECKTGTGLLVGVNAVWWVGLVRGILAKSSNGKISAS